MKAFSLLLVLSISCDPVEQDAPKNCFTVVDKSNGNVIGGAQVSINGQRYGGYYTWNGRTDANGECCFDSEASGNLYVFKEGYVRICWVSSGRIIELTPVAILKLHLQDQAPPANYSILAVEVYRPSHCGTPGLLLWQDDETNMDTFEIIHLRPGEGWISWTWWHNNIRYESDTHMLELTSGDTTYFEIVY